MHVGIKDQDQFDTALWMPFESRFLNGKGEVNSKAVSEFLRTFLLTTGQYFAPGETFEAFEQRFKGKLQTNNLVLELTKAATLYDSIRGVLLHPDPETQIALKKFQQLDSSTAFPLILKLMQMADSHQISAVELRTCLELLSGFIFRRYICGESSRPYAQWFVSACKEVGATEPVLTLERFLTERGSFPGDSRFEDSAVSSSMAKSTLLTFCNNWSIHLETRKRRMPIKLRSNTSCLRCYRKNGRMT